MRPNSAAARDVRNLLHGYVHLSKHRQSGPAVITGGKGVFVHDENGTPYLEAASGMWCTSMGFGEEALVEAATEQMRKLPYYHTIASKSVNPAIDLAEKLTQMVPIKDARVYFALSGSEANDFLVKFIWYYNNAVGRHAKKKIIGRINGYHGATVAASSLTGLRLNHRAFDLPIPNILHVSEPNHRRGARPGESHEEFATRLAEELEVTILREGPETVAAFILEPVTGAGGVIIPPPSYHAKIRAVLDRHDVLLLDDEVITGFLRTGRMWGCETMGFRPDTMTLAKGLTSAYLPLSALVLSDEIYRGLEKGCDGIGFFAHGATYSGHPVPCAVALRMLQLIEERDLAGHVARVSRHFERRLRAFESHPLVGEVRAIGLMGAVELTADKKTNRDFSPVGSVAKRVRDRAEEGYNLIARAVPSGDSIAFSPPLIISESEIDDMTERVGKALDDVADALVREKALATA
jgi:4-aminobutyrate--pyruvate transaminase